MVNFYKTIRILSLFWVSIFTLTSCNLGDNSIKGYIKGAVCTFSNQTKTPYAGGSGTASDPYVICTAAQLNNIGQYSQNWGKSFKLGADIDLSYWDGSSAEKTFHLIGDYDAVTPSFDPFTGVFDGNNKTISNFTYSNTDNKPTGFFRVVKGAQISNVTFDTVNISSTQTQLGAFVGRVESDSSGTNFETTISNCQLKNGTLSGSSSVGGLVGAVTDLGSMPVTLTVQSSSTEVTITSSAGAGGGLIGGGTFNSYISISDSSAVGAVTAGGTAVGGILGNFSGVGATISNSYADVDTISTGAGFVGGLVGLHWVGEMTVDRSYARGNVTGTGTVGGLIGQFTAGSISQSYALGSVTGTSGANVGGLVGVINGGTIAESFARGDVAGVASNIGGLVGNSNHSTVNLTDSYATGDVSGGTASVGGLVGYSIGGVMRCYSTGKVLAPAANNVGGLAGANFSSSTFSKFNFTTAWSDAITGVANVGGLYGTGLATAQSYYVANIGTFGTQVLDNPIAARIKTLANWDTTSVWSWKAKNINPTLKWYEDLQSYCSASNMAKAPYAGGSGTKADPYIICTAAQLDHLGATPADWDKHFLQKADIDLSSYDNSTVAKTFHTIGYYNLVGLVDTPFTGTYDGDNFEIQNFNYLSTTNNNEIHGFFAYTFGATLQNIIFTNAQMDVADSSQYIGVLTGYADSTNIFSVGVESGTMSTPNGTSVGGLVGSFDLGAATSAKLFDSYSRPNVSGYISVGGLVGLLKGQVDRSFSSGSVTGSTNVGGLVGYLFAGANSTIRNSYATGDVTGQLSAPGAYSGGLVGRANNVAGNWIENSFATGTLSGLGKHGGFIGYASAAAVKNVYSLSDVSGGTLNDGFAISAACNSACYFTDSDDAGRGTYVGTAAAARDGATGSGASWDFTNVWKGPYDNTQNPQLIWEP